MKKPWFGIIAIAFILGVIGISLPSFFNTSRMKIESSAFKNNGSIPAKFTCDGPNVSPKLMFSAIPEKAKSLALVMDDHDVPKTIRPDGVWDHWVVWNIRPTDTTFEENLAPPGMLGKTTSGETGYKGPCPPDREHRYTFTLYALDTMLDIPFGSSKQDLLKAMEGHIVEKATLVGKYKR